MAVAINRTGLVRVWFSTPYRLNFLGLPKTGSSTVRELLKIRVQDWKEIPSKELPDYPVITVVRDPVERAVSSYMETLRRGTFKGDFDQFLTRLDYFGTFDEHTLPMTWYLNTAKLCGVVPDIYLICDETLTDQLSELCNTEFEDIRINASSEAVHLTKAHRKFIKDLYKTDFKLYEKIRTAKGISKKSAKAQQRRQEL